MGKDDLVKSIESALTSKLTDQERYYLGFYPTLTVLEAIWAAIKANKSQGNRMSITQGKLVDKAKAIVQRIRPYLGNYDENKAIKELANTSRGLLDKLLEGL